MCLAFVHSSYVILWRNGRLIERRDAEVSSSDPNVLPGRKLLVQI